MIFHYERESFPNDYQLNISQTSIEASAYTSCWCCDYVSTRDFVSVSISIYVFEINRMQKILYAFIFPVIFSYGIFAALKNPLHQIYFPPFNRKIVINTGFIFSSSVNLNNWTKVSVQTRKKVSNILTNRK